MNDKKIKFLQDINNGKIKGSQKVLADKLGIAGSAVTYWFKGEKNPSLDNIIKMAKIFNKSEQEIKDIFSIKNEFDKNNFNDIVISKDIELLKEKTKRHDAEISLLREEIEKLKKSQGDF